MIYDWTTRGPGCPKQATHVSDAAGRRFDGFIFRLDTETGEMWRYQPDPDNPSLVLTDDAAEAPVSEMVRGFPPLTVHFVDGTTSADYVHDPDRQRNYIRDVLNSYPAITTDDRGVSAPLELNPGDRIVFAEAGYEGEYDTHFVVTSIDGAGRAVLSVVGSPPEKPYHVVVGWLVAFSPGDMLTEACEPIEEPCCPPLSLSYEMITPGCVVPGLGTAIECAETDRPVCLGQADAEFDVASLPLPVTHKDFTITPEMLTGDVPPLETWRDRPPML